MIGDEPIAAPRPDVIADVLTLAELESPRWAELSETARREGPVNDGSNEPEKPEATPTDPPEPGKEPEPGKQSPSGDEIDWKQRYEDLRPEADRRASTIADLEGKNGPERQAEALRQFNVELEPDEEDEPLDDDLRDPIEEIDQMREEQRTQAEEAEDAEFNRLESKYLEESVEKIEADTEAKYNDEEYGFIVTHALANRGEGGRPDIDGGINALKAIQTQAQEKYRKSKRTAPPPLGTEGEKKIDLKDPEARRQYMKEVVDAEEGLED